MATTKFTVIYHDVKAAVFFFYDLKVWHAFVPVPLYSDAPKVKCLQKSTNY